MDTLYAISAIPRRNDLRTPDSNSEFNPAPDGAAAAFQNATRYCVGSALEELRWRNSQEIFEMPTRPFTDVSTAFATHCVRCSEGVGVSLLLSFLWIFRTRLVSAKIAPLAANRGESDQPSLGA